MKRRLLVGLSTLFIFASLHPSIFAKTATDSVRRPSIDRVRDTVEERREEVREREDEKRAEFERHREEVKARWQELLDERRAAILERIDGHIANINERVTDHFLRALERLEAILAKIETHADRLEEKGKDVTTVRTAIDTAQTTIDAAESDVNAQKEKVYTLTITDEETVGQVVLDAMAELRADLGELKNTIEAARRAVHDTAAELREVLGSDVENIEPTP